MVHDRKYHYLYITINTINYHFYIGRHSTDNLDDSYIGSGYRLKSAIKKYGKHNFRRVIVLFFDTYDELVAAENHYITEDLIRFKNCYNVSGGGHGGYLSDEIYKNA